MPMTFARPSIESLPLLVADLAAAERIVLRAFRHWGSALMSGPAADGDIVWTDFVNALGTTHGKAALTAFAALICAVGRAQRRPNYHHRPGCPYLTADKLWLIRQALVGAVPCIGRTGKVLILPRSPAHVPTRWIALE